jgi:hypothetical protein
MRSDFRIVERVSKENVTVLMSAGLGSVGLKPEDNS